MIALSVYTIVIFVNSHLSYLNPIWGSAAVSNMKGLQILQNKALKLVYSLPRLTPSIDLYTNDSSSILPVNYLSNFELAFLVFKISNNFIKFSQSFNLNSHSYATRVRNIIFYEFSLELILLEIVFLI